MNVKLLTLQCVKNYGSVLQTYATEQLLNQYFDHVETLNYIRPDTLDKRMIHEWTKDEQGIKKIVKSIYLFPMSLRYQSIFNTFIKKYLHLTKEKYYQSEDFVRLYKDADAYCVGSDQVWNSQWNRGFIPELFLSFVPEQVMKFAFCSSFGKIKLDDWEKEPTKQLLQKFDFISVRESSALDILNELNIHNGIHLLDPTLLLDSSFWDKITAPRLIKEDYLLVYQLNPNKEFDNYAIKFAQTKNLKVIYLSMKLRDIKKKGKTFLMPQVEEFLSLIKNASYVITDSFHGTAFSINFNKNIIVIYPQHFSTRLQSILSWANIEERHLSSYEDFHIADQPIDYKFINQKLKKEREKANDYLSNIVLRIKNERENKTIEG